MIQRYQVADKNMQALCLAACDAKGFIWNIFFGWRRTWYDGDTEIMEFLLPPRLYKELLYDYRYFFPNSQSQEFILMLCKLDYTCYIVYIILT